MRKNCLVILLLLVPTVAPSNLLAADQASAESSTKTLVWPDGTRYVGGVVDGKRTGKGTIFWEDGTRFVGQFADDMRNGPGSMILPDGTVYTGYFKDDELVDSPATSIVAAAGPVQSDTSASDIQKPVADIPGAQASEPLVTQVLAEEDQGEPAAQVAPGAPVQAIFDTQVTTLDDDVKQQLMETINLWKAAWADKNVPQYLSNYSDDFAIPGKLTRKRWEALRRSRLTRPRYIDLSIVYEKFSIVETNIADVFFKQTYQSNLYRDVTNKVLRLRKEGHAWKILVERSR